MIFAREAFFAARAAKSEKVFAHVPVQNFDGLELFGAMITSEALGGSVVNRPDVVPQIGNASEQGRAQFAQEPFFFGVHDEVIGQMRLLFEGDVAARVALVLLFHHVVSPVLVKRGQRREGLATDVASQSAVLRLALAHGIFRVQKLDVTHQNLSRIKVRLLTDVTSQS